MIIEISDNDLKEAVAEYNASLSRGESRLTLKCVKHFLAAGKVLDHAVEDAAGSCHLPATMWP